MPTVYLSLGSNMGNREANLRAALDQFAAPDLRVVRVSPIYETEPIDYTEQNWFLNLVAEAQTDISPFELLSRIQHIESALGRERIVPKGPRTLDIDILLYGALVINNGALEIPHARMPQRRFVLAPLADLAPALRHPLTHQTIREMLDAAPPAVVRRLTELG